MPELGSSVDRSDDIKRDRLMNKHDRRVLLRATRRFTSSFLLIEYFIGRKRDYVNLDKKFEMTGPWF